MHRSVLRGIVLIAIAGAATAVLLLIPSPKQKKQHPPNNDPWLLVSYDPDNPYGTYLGNGFISTRIMGDGVGSQDGQPLPCYMAGLYEDEKLIPTPTWSDLRFNDGIAAGREFRVDKTQHYKQTLNLRTGILTTEATWKHEDRAMRGTIEVLVSRARPGVALMRARMVPEQDVLIRVFHSTDSQSDWIEGGVEREPVAKDWDVWINTYKRRGSSIFVSIAQCLVMGKRARDFPARGPRALDCIDAEAGNPFEVTSYAALGRGPDAASAQRVALGELKSALALGSRLVDEHKRAWADLWKKDIIIDGPAKDQQAIHSCMFYLLQSVREGSKWSIPPMGLSNNAFSGHVFWDADTWMFPALIWQHPELAKSIVEYRYHTLPGAMANAKAHGFAGAEYAWESGYTGREDTPEGLVYRHERHINGDVALAQWQYYLATGDLSWLKTRGFPVIKATADYWISRVTLNKNANRYEIHKVVPPDENAELVNNSAYTNAIAKLNMEIAVRAARLVGASVNPKWSDVAARMYIPFDRKNNRFIPFDGYKGIDAKQADVELLAYPLQFSFARQDMTDIYRNTLRYYAPRVLANGPAMTSSVHAVIAARLGDSAGAYKYWRKSWTQYLRGSFNYFNEKKSTTVDNMCFLTGAAGPIQSILFGFAGLRMDYLSDGPMGLDRMDSFCLPKQWKSLRITGVQWRGRSYDVEVKPGKKTHVLRAPLAAK
jgi:trehalose/maltose hydrolase-like predicted phosphorylase